MESKKIVKLLEVKTEIPLSDKMEDPSVIEPTESIKIVFSENLDMNTVSEGIKLYKVKSNLAEEEVDVKIISDENSPSVLNINKSDKSKFTEGEEYKLSINNQVKSLSGASLEEEFNNYFAVDYSFNLDAEGILDLNNERTLIVCISDLHLGANDSYSEITKNRDALVRFLKSYSNFTQYKRTGYSR